MLSTIINNQNFVSIASEVFYFFRSGMRLKTPLDWGSHKQSWNRIHEALENGNPEWALLTSWGILEKEAKLKFGNGLKRPGEGRNASICNQTADVVKFSSAEKLKLKSAMKKRNRAAHGDETSVDWSDVDIILSAAYRLYKSL